MAKGKEADAVDTAPDTDNEKTLAQVLQGLAAAQEDGPIRQIRQHRAKYRTPGNPTGGPRPEMTRDYRMQGSQLRAQMLSNEEIVLLNQLKAGRYREGRWIVTEEVGGTDKPKVSIYYSNKTPENRLELAQAAPTLAILLQLMITEGPGARA